MLPRPLLTFLRAVTSQLPLALIAPAALAQAAYTFTLDGNTLEPAPELMRVRGGFVSLRGTPDEPTAGDLVWIAAKTDCLVRLTEPGLYDFFDELETQGRLRLRRGEREQVAVLDSARLVTADPATRRALLGVVVDRWNSEVAAALASLDPAVPLVVTDGTAVGGARALPELPPAIHHLALAYETKEGFGDLASAAKLTSLRTLYLGGYYCGFTKVDVRPFANAVQLRTFHCDQGDLVGAEIVERFRELRMLAARDFPLATFAALRHATGLRRIYCWGPDAGDIAPRSLTPLAELPRLEHIKMLFTPIAELPATGFASLRTLYLQGCGLPVAQQRAFRRAHPACRIDGEVDDEQLQELLAGADRLVLRTGGTCHRDQARETVLLDTAAGDQIAKVLPLLHVVEDRDSFHCGCCGGPTLVFFAAGKEIASIGVHHGQSIRWADGPWNSDARLTAAAGEALAEWLAAHGDARATQERRMARARAEAGPRRARLRAAVFGATLADDADLEALAGEWLQRAADAASTDGGATLLRLLGCHEGAWDAPDEFEQGLLTKAAESVANAGAWDELLARCKADEHAALGLAALWVDRTGDGLPAGRRAAALPIVAPAALCSPQPWNRARMLQRLRDDASDDASDVLIAALDGRFAPRQVEADELVAPGGMRVIHPDDPVLAAEGAPTPVLAALCLAHRKHLASLPRIRELANSASARDARLLRKAIEQLEAAK